MAFEIKRGDRRPYFRVLLTQTDPGNPLNTVPVDLTSAAGVKFLLKQTSTLKVTAPAVFVDQAAGIVEYRWAAGDTDTPGTYNAEFEVDWGGEPQTFPASGYFTCIINDDLG